VEQCFEFPRRDPAAVEIDQVDPVEALQVRLDSAGMLAEPPAEAR